MTWRPALDTIDFSIAHYLKREMEISGRVSPQLPLASELRSEQRVRTASDHTNILFACCLAASHAHTNHQRTPIIGLSEPA